MTDEPDSWINEDTIRQSRTPRPFVDNTEETKWGRRPAPGRSWQDVEEQNFIDCLNDVAGQIYATAVAKGFWDSERNEGEIIALIHSELSECLEAIRHENPPDKHCPEFSSAEVELADAVIRVLDYCHAKKWRLGEAILAKIAFNATRPYKHGKQF